MKELSTALQETGRLLREYDPIAAEAAERLFEEGQAIFLAEVQAHAQELLSREHPLPTRL